MSLELLFVVRGEKAPGPPAVVVQSDAFAGVLAQVVGTPVTVFFETVLLLEKTRVKLTFSKVIKTALGRRRIIYTYKRCFL